MAQGTVINLECRNCGGPVDLSVDGLFATCMYCGSKQMLQPSTSLFERLQDFPNSTFHPRHLPPLLTPDEALERLIAEAESDPIGFKGIGGLATKVESGFLPIWVIEAKVHCTWSGKYSEEHTVTKFRTVMRTRTVGKSIETYPEQEAYNELETSWHQTNGTHDFTHSFYRAANQALGTQATSMLSRLAQDLPKTSAGLPPPLDGYAFVPAVSTEREAWNDPQASVEEWGTQECIGQAEQMDRVSATLTGADFSLVFAPFAVVSYDLNERQYKHVYDLIEGTYCGDPPPVDRSSVGLEGLRASAREKNAAQSAINKIIRDGEAEIAHARKLSMRTAQIWIAVTLVNVLIAVLSSGSWPFVVFICSSIFGFFASAAYWSRGQKTAELAKQRIEATFPKETPWKDFIATRRLELLRAARIACDLPATESGKIESFGVLLDCCDYEARGQRSRKLRELEADSVESTNQADIIAQSLCVSDAAPPMLSEALPGGAVQSRIPIAAGDRKVLAIFFLIVGLGLIIAWLLDYRQRTPSAALVSKALASQISDSVYEVSQLKFETTQTAPSQVSIEVHEALKLRKPLYEKEDLSAFMAATFPAASEARGKIRAILAGRDGARILETAGLPTSTSDAFDGITILKVKTPTGTVGTLDGQMGGVRSQGEWHFSGLVRATTSPNIAGQLREGFAGDVVIIGDESDDKRLKALASKELETFARLYTAQDSFQKQEQARHAAAREEFVRSFAAGSIFKGKAVSQYQGSFPLEMVIDKLDVSSGEVFARISGKRADVARRFTGRIGYEDSAEQGVLTLATRAADAIYAGGPIVNISEGWELRFSVTGSHLEAQSSNRYWHYTFDRLSDSEAAQLNAARASDQSNSGTGTQASGVASISTAAAGTEISGNSEVQPEAGAKVTMVAPFGPPATRNETVPRSPGTEYIWIRGHWSWHQGRWDWTNGHWELFARPGSVWVPGKWVKMNSQWGWIDGYYSTQSPAATGAEGLSGREVAPEAPPALIAEATGRLPGRGYFWIPGRWQWKGGWVWFAGHFDINPDSYRTGGWAQGHWAHSGSVWIWVEGHWY